MPSLLPTAALLCCALTATAADAVACPRFAAPPAIDGALGEWAGRPALTMSEPPVDDLKVEGARLGWDAGHLYLALQVQDRALVNAKAAGPELSGGDCAELRLVAADGAIIRLYVAPTTAGGKPGLHLSKAAGPKLPATVIATCADPAVADPAGVAWAVAKRPDGWTVEVSIPAAVLGLALAPGAAYPVVLVVWDRDATDHDEWKEWRKRSESANQKKGAEEWPRLTLAE